MNDAHLGKDLVTLDRLPKELAEINGYFRETEGSRHLKEKIRLAGHSLRIDYDKYAMEFNNAYFVRNYVKCFLYLGSLPSTFLLDTNSVVDLGGGAGPFSLAAKYFNPQLNTLVVDRSGAQIAYARMLSAVWGLKHVSNTEIADALSLNLDPATMRILSYWVCENNIELTCNAGLRSKIFGNRCIIVDYPHIVRQTTKLASSFGGYVSNVVVAQHNVCSQLFKILGQRTITFGGACIEFRD